MSAAISQDHLLQDDLLQDDLDAGPLDFTFPPEDDDGVPGAKSLVGRPVPAWDAQVREMPAATLLELPVPPALALHVPGVKGIVRVSEHGEADEGEIGFDFDEWRALVLGTEADRVWPQDLAMFCRRKHDEPAYRLEPFDALAGGQPDPEQRWNVGDVFDRLGVQVLSVQLA